MTYYVYCRKVFKWSIFIGDIFSKTKPLTQVKLNDFHLTCAYLQCAPTQIDRFEYIAKVCGPGTYFHPAYLVCDFMANVKAIKPECGGEGLSEGVGFFLYVILLLEVCGLNDDFLLSRRGQTTM